MESIWYLPLTRRLSGSPGWSAAGACSPRRTGQPSPTGHPLDMYSSEITRTARDQSFSYVPSFPKENTRDHFGENKRGRKILGVTGDEKYLLPKKRIFLPSKLSFWTCYLWYHFYDWRKEKGNVGLAYKVAWRSRDVRDTIVWSFVKEYFLWHTLYTDQSFVQCFKINRGSFVDWIFCGVYRK